MCLTYEPRPGRQVVSQHDAQWHVRVCLAELAVLSITKLHELVVCYVKLSAKWYHAP